MILAHIQRVGCNVLTRLYFHTRLLLEIIDETRVLQIVLLAAPGHV
jgi:hypothetical protein